ncbi:11382_t:CDS:2 [Diversispora eburnea]|uniref:11382_t:CDS:1 n=1 Tax=Diversispora eburnea TaxID=1213867 RepID=A0A9N9AHN2_9GLOM|nr:11382_t:CDS:2 [Diversispora eburnea]
MTISSDIDLLKDFISEKEFQERKTRRDLLVKIVILKVRGSDTISNLEQCSTRSAKASFWSDGNYLEILDPRHHHDFTNISRKYDNGDDTWLGIDKNSWPVSYHGTAKNNTVNCRGLLSASESMQDLLDFE